MKQDASQVIGSDEAAFVISADGGISLLLPRCDPNKPISPAHRLFLAIAAKLNDPEWVEELLCGERASGRKIGFL